MRAWKEAEASGIRSCAILSTSSTQLLHFELVYKYSAAHINNIQMSPDIHAKVKNSVAYYTHTHTQDYLTRLRKVGFSFWPKLFVLIKIKKKDNHYHSLIYFDQISVGLH